MKNLVMILRLLNSNDFEIVSGFIDEECKLLSKIHFFPPNEVIIEKCLDYKSGNSIGAFQNGKLIGIRLSYKPGLLSDNHGYDLMFNSCQLMEVVQFHGTLISARFRNSGLGKKLVKENCEIILKNNSSIILATVHPKNFASIKMLEENGFERNKQVLKYENLPRIIFLKRSK